jgi:adenylate cyclase
VDSDKLQTLFDWLVDGCPGATTPMAVLARMGPSLVGAGVPLARIGAAVRTLHPHIAGRHFVWEPGRDVQVSEQPWASLDVQGPRPSPISHIFETGEEVRARLEPARPTGWENLDELRDKGFTYYLGLPLRFMGGTNHCISFACRDPAGFSDEEVKALRHVTRPLTRVAETLALMRTAANLLNAYVGRDAGDRILQGHIQRGDTESIRCVIWFSDLRGFTSMSSERAPKEIIQVLNDFFDCQVPAIERKGGEVLKFMGDGLLAIFPVTAKADFKAAGEQALNASAEALEALARLNVTRAKRNEPPLRFGVGLHVGEVAYGNIGGASRLDFTAIGPAVNIASRIEGLTSTLGKPVLLSAELASKLGAGTKEVGQYPLKGIALPQAIFEPLPG